MYNTLIVDDEALVRIGLKTSIDWEKEGFKISADLQDGGEALEYIRKSDIDLVLLDIKMPKMDGIQLLKEMKEINFKGKVVVLSSFDDYEYVRQAMKLGAYDYLHKPAMGPEEITGILRNVKSELDKEKSHIKFKDENMDLSEKIQKKDLIKNFVLGSIKYSSELQQQFDKLGINIKPGNFVVMIFDMDKKINILEGKERGDIYISFGDYIESILQQAIRSYKNIEYFKLDDYKSMLIYNTSGISSLLEKSAEIRKFADEIKDIFKQFLNLSFTVGVSGFHDKPSEVAKAVKEANSSVEEKFYMGYGKTIFYSEITKGREDNKYTIDNRQLLNELKNCIINNEMDELKDKISETIENLKNKELYSKKEVYHLVYDIISILKDTFIKYDQPELNKEADVFIKKIGYMETIFELEKKIIDFTLKVSDILNKRQSEEYGNIIHQIIKFINQRYYEDISLEIIAAHVSMNPSYISRLFKQKTNMNITDYITKVRMEKAKELLKESSLKVYEISQRVGYYDYRYFSKLFKEYTYLTPQEYRQLK